MKAVVLDDHGKVRFSDVQRRDPGAGEVTVRVSHTGICGTDLHAENLNFFRRGTVLGHEFTGTVAAVGAEVPGWSPGDRVVINPNGEVCGRCEQCRSGDLNLCAELRRTGVGVAVDGGLAEYATVAAATLNRLPDAVSLLDGVWVEPVAVAVRAAGVAGVSPDDAVVVYGAGPIGLALLSVLMVRGATDVSVVEPSEFRRAFALRAGATAAHSPADYQRALQDGSVARPVRAFDCVGRPDVVEQAVSALKPRGVLTIVGQSPTTPCFDADDLILKEITVQGSFIYVEEFAEAIALLESGALQVGAWTTSVHGIDDAMIAFDDLRDPQTSVKSVIRLS